MRLFSWNYRETAPRYRVCVIGDFGWNTASDQTRENALVRMISKLNPDYIITTGDNWQGQETPVPNNAYTYTVKNPFAKWYNSQAALNRFCPCYGNHDADTGLYLDTTYGFGSSIPVVNYASGLMQYTYLIRLWHPNSENYQGLVNSYGIAPIAEFVFLSSEHLTEPYPNNQRTWLQQLNTAYPGTYTWRFLVVHKPINLNNNTAAGLTTPDSVHNPLDSSLDFQGNFGGAIAVFAGHHHFYERSEGLGITQVVCGCAAIPSQLRSYVYNSIAAHHKVGYQLEQAIINLDISEGSVEMTALTINGIIFDRKTWTRGITQNY